MADIDNVLERLVTDAAFRGQLGSDPAAALSGYDLSAEDLQLLASSMDDGDSAQRGVEQRTSKSAVLGLLASLTGGGGGEEFHKFKGSDNLRAPSDDAEEMVGRLAGKPKPGEITMTRSSIPAHDATSKDTSFFITDTSAPSSGDEAAKGGGVDWSKTSDASAGKGASNVVMDPTNAAPGEDPAETALAFKQGVPIKWEAPDALSNAGVNDAPIGGDADLAPESASAVKLGPFKGEAFGVSTEATEAPVDLGQRVYPKIEIVNLKAGDTSRKLEFGQMKAGDTSVSTDDASMQDLHIPTDQTDQILPDQIPTDQIPTDQAHEDFLKIEDA